MIIIAWMLGISALCFAILLFMDRTKGKTYKKRKKEAIEKGEEYYVYCGYQQPAVYRSVHWPFKWDLQMVQVYNDGYGKRFVGRKGEEGVIVFDPEKDRIIKEKEEWKNHIERENRESAIRDGRRFYKVLAPDRELPSKSRIKKFDYTIMICYKDLLHEDKWYYERREGDLKEIIFDNSYREGYDYVEKYGGKIFQLDADDWTTKERCSYLLEKKHAKEQAELAEIHKKLEEERKIKEAEDKLKEDRDRIIEEVKAEITNLEETHE